MHIVTLLDYAIIAVVAFFAAACAGISGYGVGLLMPLVLVPVAGAEATLPILAAASIFTNASRLAAFRQEFDRRHAGLILLTAIPGCIISAYFYTLLDGRGASLVIGSALLLMVPGRRLLARRQTYLTRRGIGAAGVGFGFLNGSAPGVGVVLISILLATGMTGQAVVATDAGISLVLGFVKIAVFQSAGALDLSGWIIAAVIGAAAAPAAFFARWLVRRLPARIHITLLDAVVVVGGLLLIVRAIV